MPTTPVAAEGFGARVAKIVEIELTVATSFREIIYIEEISSSIIKIAMTCPFSSAIQAVAETVQQSTYQDLGMHSTRIKRRSGGMIAYLIL